MSRRPAAPQPDSRRPTTPLLLLLLALLAPACGGGGGAGGGAGIPSLPGGGGGIPAPAEGALTGLVELPAAGGPALAPARLPAAGATVTLVGTGRAAISDADGRYTITGVPPGTHALTVVAASGATRYAWYLDGLVVTAGGTTEAPLARAVPAVAATGRVVDDRGPVSGAEVRLVGRRALTDASGAFSIPDAPPGLWRVVVASADHTPREFEIRIESDGAVADLRVERIPREKVAAPVATADPPGGTSETGFTVTLSCATPGATIRYTLDGTAPGAANGAVYAGPFRVEATRVVKAVALAVGMEASDVVSLSLTLVTREQTAAPVISPPGGTYAMPLAVGISCATPGAAIRYTLDGRAPTATTGFAYTGTISIERSATIIAYATHPDRADSGYTAATYFALARERAATPVITPDPGTYPAAQTVEITCATPGATIRYTTNGLVPTPWSATLYEGPFRVTGRTQIRAYAEKAGLDDSLLAECLIVVSGFQIVEPPVFGPAPGTYHGTVAVTIATGTPGATIRYTLDGSTPTASYGELYTGPVILPYDPAASTQWVVKACGFANGYFTSRVEQAFYVVEPPTVATPIFEPPPGRYDAPVGVSIRCATDGAAIRHTLDGTDPVPSSPLFTGTVEISVSAEFRARATKAGMFDSPVATAVYTIDFPDVATPTIVPNGGSFIGTREVALRCATEGALIRFTLDGSTPDETSPLYAGTFEVAANATVKARATKPLMDPSKVASATFRITPATVATPTSNIASFTYTEPQLFALSCATEGAVIRYTLDGSLPDETSPLYEGTFEVTRTTVIRAVAFKDGWLKSAVLSRTLTFSYPALPRPVADVASGIYFRTIEVALTCGVEGAEIRYTLDGSTPTRASPLYTGTLEIATNLTLKAFAVMELRNDSPLLTLTYAFEPEPLHPPVITPVSGVYAGPLTVTIACATAGARIRYTVDGSPPTETNGFDYTGPFAVSGTPMRPDGATVRAYSARDDLGTSELVSVDYEFSP